MTGQQFERDCEVATRLAERDEDEYTDPGDLDEPGAEEAL